METSDIAYAVDGREMVGRLLAAIRTVLQDTHLPHIASAELARALNESEMSFGRDPIDARELAARLRQYDIRPRLLRHGNDVFRGYTCGDFKDAFCRYLPSTSQA